MSAPVIEREEARTDHPFIPLSVPEIRGNEWAYVKDCLDSGWVSSVGSYVDRFERELAARVGAKYGVATSSGTAALHTALQVAGVEQDDEVLVSTITFIASANSIRYVGAWPVFMDAEPHYWQMDSAKVVAFLDRECDWTDRKLVNRSTGRRVKAIMPVHVLGHPVDIDPILEAASKYDLVVVEDSSESLGATYRGRRVGCLGGDISCFSFNGNKLVTTGGGGMIVTDREDWARRCKFLTTQAKEDGTEYIHPEVGYNYRLTNVQAAIGCAQLELLDKYVQSKRDIAAHYQTALASIPGIVPMPSASWADPTFWLYTALVNAEDYGTDARGLISYLEANRVQARPLWQPMHRSAAHAGCQAYHCDVADRLYADAVSLPCSVGLNDASRNRVSKLIAQRGGMDG